MTQRYSEPVPDIPVAPILRELTGEDVIDVLPGEGWRKISCPFHEDRNPSASMSYLGFKCFSCEREGDAIKLLMTEEGGNFSDSLSRAKTLTGVEGTSPSRRRRRRSELLGYTRD